MNLNRKESYKSKSNNASRRVSVIEDPKIKNQLATTLVTNASSRIDEDVSSSLAHSRNHVDIKNQIGSNRLSIPLFNEKKNTKEHESTGRELRNNKSSNNLDYYKTQYN